MFYNLLEGIPLMNYVNIFLGREQQEMLAKDLAKNSESFSPTYQHESSYIDHHVQVNYHITYD